MRDTLWLASWLTPFVTPLGRREREILLRILHSNSLELRVALLRHQLRHMGY